MSVSEVSSVSKVDWDEQVQVQVLEPISSGKGHVVQGGVLKWDGISLAEAVERCMAMAPEERAKAGILAPSGLYDGRDIEVLAGRRDFPELGDGLN
jgi:hypothetical protein